MKQAIRITESQLKGLIAEAVSEVVRESKIGNFFNKFRRNTPVSDVARRAGGNGVNFVYNNKSGTYHYMDNDGSRYDTGIGYDEDRVGMNWNPFVSTQGNQVSRKDADNMVGKLRRWADGNVGEINRSKEIERYYNERLKQIDKADRDRRNREHRKDLASEFATEREAAYKDPIRKYFGTNPLNEDFNGRKAVVAAYIGERDIAEMFERLVENGKMSESEFYSKFEIGYGNEDTVIPNLFRLAEKLGQTPNKPITRQKLEYVERACDDVYEYGEYTVYPADPTILFVKFVN